uniref:Uncharacterized protein n=1 Tax=Haptolina brevifila TaxID=156173 RepID=A0A7S2IYI4_9EUKA|mmetsp:Transcript_73690/g.146535  ORF Transcript_73690/g.146535 Transcript_73690/m.146535 type:complete len:381 (+) Transcript_73690:101-1243(+)
MAGYCRRSTHHPAHRISASSWCDSGSASAPALVSTPSSASIPRSVFQRQHMVSALRVSALREQLKIMTQPELLASLEEDNNPLIEAIDPQSMTIALVSYRQERRIGEGANGPFDRFCLDGQALEGILEAAERLKADAIWLDVWCYRVHKQTRDCTKPGLFSQADAPQTQPIYNLPDQTDEPRDLEQRHVYSQSHVLGSTDTQTDTKEHQVAQEEQSRHPGTGQGKTGAMPGRSFTRLRRTLRHVLMSAYVATPKAKIAELGPNPDDFFDTLDNVLQGISAVVWLPQTKLTSSGEYPYRLWCTFEAVHVQKRGLPVAIAGLGMTPFQRRVLVLGSLTPGLWGDGTITELALLNLSAYIAFVGQALYVAFVCALDPFQCGGA